MKMHIRNLAIAIVTYFVSFFGMFIASMITDIISFDSDYRNEERNYILSLVFMVLLSFVCYLIYFYRQRKIAKEHIYTDYLGLRTRILGGSIASFFSMVVFFICLFLTTERDGRTETSTLLNYINITGIFLSLFIAVNFVDFIVLRPRP
jgi:MFS family permease